VSSVSEPKLSVRGAAGADPAVIEFAASEPSWKTEVPIEGPEEAAALILGVRCSKMPLGSKFQLTVPSGRTEAGEPWAGLDSGRHEILMPQESWGSTLDWPAGVRTKMTIAWWAEGKVPEPGASIQPFIGIITGNRVHIVIV
jgi:hypothetical protein